MNSTELLNEIKNQLELLKHKGYDKNSFKSGYLLGYAKALQLRQTGVIVQSEQLKTCEHNFADVYDHTGTQIVGKKCLNGCGF